MKMNLKWPGWAFVALIFLGPGASPVSRGGQLDDHPSPYLKLHASDPVEWRSWGEDVLRQAQAENRLIFLSIGYYACHWCHVMQRESYRDDGVAQLINRHFIPVKVDRELRPELDRRMINFVENLTGQAGWPLNVFLTPDGYPLTGFTYLPRDNFHAVLGRLVEQWDQRPDEIHSAAQAYFEQSDQVESRSRLMSLPDENYARLVDAFVSQAMLIADEMQGGFGEVSKFPSYPQLAALLELVRLRPGLDADVSRFLRLTLDTMAKRNLMDHLDGGFFRYVTDPDWRTPHFEKMLYDNAMLARLYFNAHSQWPDAGYADVGLRTVRFMREFLADREGGFFSSLSAVDENDVEGGAYYWSPGQLRQLLSGAELEALDRAGALNDEQSILLPPLHGHGVAEPVWRSIERKLRQAAKPRMPIDDKRLASWNALALNALLLAEGHSDEPGIGEHSDRLYRLIRDRFVRAGRLYRLIDGTEHAETTLEDHAFTAHAVQHYANRRNSAEAEALALALVEQAFDRYYVKGLWRQTEASLIPGETGEAVIQDGVLPSPLSVLLETVESMPKPDPALRGLAGLMSDRLTQDMLDLPFHYGSAIVLKYRRLAKTTAAE